MRGEYDDRFFWCVANVFDCESAAASKIFDDCFVVYDLVFDIDGRAKDLEGIFDGFHGARHSSAESSRSREHNFSDRKGGVGIGWEALF